MLGTIDSFDFILARDLGMTLEEVGELSNLEVIKWRSFYKYENAMQELANKSKR